VTAPTAAHVVVVPVLLPLSVYHATDPGDTGYTRCGKPVHGWYAMSERQARDNADRPCLDGCFSGTCPFLTGQVPARDAVVERFGIPRQRRRS